MVPHGEDALTGALQGGNHRHGGFKVDDQRLVIKVQNPAASHAGLPHIGEIQGNRVTGKHGIGPHPVLGVGKVLEVERGGQPGHKVAGVHRGAAGQLTRKAVEAPLTHRVHLLPAWLLHQLLHLFQVAAAGEDNLGVELLPGCEGDGNHRPLFPQAGRDASGLPDIVVLE